MWGAACTGSAARGLLRMFSNSVQGRGWVEQREDVLAGRGQPCIVRHKQVAFRSYSYNTHAQLNARKWSQTSVRIGHAETSDRGPNQENGRSHGHLSHRIC